MKNFSAFIFSFFLAANAHAIVSLDKLHLGDKQAGFKGSVSFGLSGASGYSERFRVKSVANALWNLNKSLYYVTFDYGYGKSNGIEDQNKTFLHARKIKSISDSFAWEIFSQVEQNKFARLNFRGLLGGGSRFSLSHLGDNIMHLGLGGFYSRESLINSSTATDNGSENIFRANIYFLKRFSFGNNISIFEALYFQPSLISFSDFRVLNIVGLTSVVSKQFSLRLTLELTHDSQPPQGITKTDWNYATGLEYNF